MENQILAVPDISCGHCKMSIEDATLALEGVTESRVDVPAKTVAVTFEAGRVDLEKIVSAIEEQGYEVAR